MTSNWAPIVLCMNPFIHEASHYPAMRTPHSSPSSTTTLQQFAPSRLVPSHYGSSTNPNPPPKSMASQISMIGGEYKVRTITGDEFDVIYTRSSATVKRCLARFRRMFENSNDEWVAGLDVEYTIVLGSEKKLKDAEKKKPAVIQVCVHDLCLVYHICHADIECEEFKNFLGAAKSNSFMWTLQTTNKSWVG